MTLLEDPAAAEAMHEVLGHIASPGSFFTGAERVSIAAHARVARGIPSPDPVAALPEIAATAAARVAANAMSTRQSDVQAWIQSGLDVLAYVELVSVVSHISSIDSYHFALGQEVVPLPTPVEGSPVPNVDPEAKVSNAWVPTVGMALAPTSLSALPAEKASKRALATAWYLNDSVIHKYAEEPGRELGRPQMELVASRTSFLNECFF